MDVDFMRPMKCASIKFTEYKPYDSTGTIGIVYVSAAKIQMPIRS